MLSNLDIHLLLFIFKEYNANSVILTFIFQCSSLCSGI